MPTSAYNPQVETGIRPFDLSRDLGPVAELIAVSFARELNGRGAVALREMRAMSHFGGLLGVLNRSTGEFNDFLSGFVWVDRGTVVGNVTVQRADKYATRWQIANVAVAPAYRGRGISRQLVEKALEHATQAGGQWAVLQVYAGNTVARHLYQSLGFEDVGESPKCGPPVCRLSRSRQRQRRSKRLWRQTGRPCMNWPATRWARWRSGGGASSWAIFR